MEGRPAVAPQVIFFGVKKRTHILDVVVQEQIRVVSVSLGHGEVPKLELETGVSCSHE